nr:hypothetical protein Iba_chr06cCG13980 [Ipomoea batatas]
MPPSDRNTTATSSDVHPQRNYDISPMEASGSTSPLHDGAHPSRLSPMEELENPYWLRLDERDDRSVLRMILESVLHRVVMVFRERQVHDARELYVLWGGIRETHYGSIKAGQASPCSPVPPRSEERDRLEDHRW